MFEFHCTFDLAGNGSRALPLPALPALAWGRVGAAVQRVEAPGLVAHYAEHAPGAPSYGRDARLHLFVIGEARLRTDATLPRDVAHLPSPLPAPALLALHRRAPDRFLDWLKGNYVLVLADEAARQMTLHSGRFAVTPLYYARDGGRVICSTSLAAVARSLSPRPGPDPVAAIEARLFNYPLGSRTYVSGVSVSRPAETLRIAAGRADRHYHWEVRTLYRRPQLPAREALEEGARRFHRTVNDLTADQQRLCLSFTSGFDSRIVLGVLERDQADLLGYAFGIPESLNLTIPRRLAGQIGLRFLPIVLADDYARAFDEYARRAVLLSDGLSTLERANYPYAFERLREFSPVVLSGLFGSELLRTFQNVGEIVSDRLMRLNLADEPLAELDRLLDEPSRLALECARPSRAVGDGLRADLAEILVARFGDLAPDRRFYMLLLTEALRKYFGAELQMERPYAVNRAPFLDDEFVEFLFGAPFAGVHSGTLRPSLRARYRSHHFYAYILHKYRPELLAATTDHGYPPADLLSPFAPLLIAPKAAYRRWRRRTGYREFKTEEWTEGFYRRQFAARGTRDDGPLAPLAREFAAGTWRARRREYAREVSLAIWHEAVAS